MTRSFLTPTERALAMDLLGGTPTESIATMGRADRETARLAYEWLRFLALTAEAADQADIDHLYLAISIIECEDDGLSIEVAA